MTDDSDPCFGPCHACEKNWDTSYYFRPLNAHTCHECREANRHLMTIGDKWDELMLKWNRIQLYWVWKVHYILYLVWKLGPVGAYRHRKSWKETPERISK